MSSLELKIESLAPQDAARGGGRSGEEELGYLREAKGPDIETWVQRGRYGDDCAPRMAQKAPSESRNDPMEQGEQDRTSSAGRGRLTGRNEWVKELVVSLRSTEEVGVPVSGVLAVVLGRLSETPVDDAHNTEA